MCAERFEALTPLYKGTESLWSGEPVVKTELLARNMAPQFTSSKLEAVILKVNIWASSSHCI
jgi:hypothetical protein